MKQRNLDVSLDYWISGRKLKRRTKSGEIGITCEKCEKAQTEGTGIYPYRIGNKEFGWAAILIVACKDHAKLAMDKLNDTGELVT